MSEIVRLAALAVLAAVLLSVLAQYNKAVAVVASVSVCCLFLLVSARLLQPLAAALQGWAKIYSGADFSAVVKAVGIALIAQGAADICADAGQNAVAGRVILAGKAAILVAALPLLQQMIALLAELLR